MKTQLIYLLLFIAACSTTASGVKRSESASGIYAEINLDQGRSLSASKEIYYGFLRSTNSPQIMMLCPTKEYLCRIQLMDEKGRNVAPTRFGGSFGNSFSKLTNYSYSVIEKMPANGSNAEHPYVRWLRPDATSSEKFPSADRLFQLTKPGRYILRLEFQVFEMDHQGANYTYKLIRLPKVEVPVEKVGD